MGLWYGVWLHTFSLVDTYKCMLTLAFFLKFCEIRYFKWHIMLKLKFRERVGHNSMMLGLGYNPEVMVMVMVVVEATVK